SDKPRHVGGGCNCQHALKKVLILQEQTGERLGDILLRLGFINQQQLTHSLSIQYDLELFPLSKVDRAKNECNEVLSKRKKQWLEHYKITPIEYKEKEKITLAIHDPTNELLSQKIIRYFSKQKITFVLINPLA
ncbi:MAG: hypothetical protein ACOYKA_06800, partial [Legionellaceae bacterium]